MHEFLSRLRFWRDHRWAPDHMSAYLDSDLAPRGRGRMERHLGECDECRAVVGGLRMTIDALRRLPPPEGGRALQIAAAVRVRLGEQPGSRP